MAVEMEELGGIEICLQKLCNPIDCSPPSSSVRGILQARILEWVAMPFSRGICPIQELNRSLLHCRRILILSKPPGKPENTGVDSISLSRGISRPRNQTGVSCIAGESFTSRTTREDHSSICRSC